MFEALVSSSSTSKISSPLEFFLGLFGLILKILSDSKFVPRLLCCSATELTFSIDSNNLSEKILKSEFMFLFDFGMSDFLSNSSNFLICLSSQLSSFVR
jgi:hypothetical protein